LTLQQLSYFLAAARHGSFSAAAEALHMAQPSLSEQVRRLEAELGVDLFTRVGRGLVLTEAGRSLQPEAERVVAAVEAARASVLEVRELRGGTVSFGTFGAAPFYRLADLIAAVRREHPGLNLRFVGQNSSEVADAVRDGELEAGMIVLPIDDRALEVKPVLRDTILFASRDSRLLRSRMTIERLAELPLILYDARWGSDDPTRRQVAERAQAAGVRLDVTIEVEAPEIAFDLAARGFGHTIVPRTIVVNRRFPSALGTVEFQPTLVDTFALITRRGAHVSPATRVVLRAAERHLEGLRKRVAVPSRA
jgi:DNA-binding transcriptional LysR family regulator